MRYMRDMYQPVTSSLRSRLLVLTVVFVMMVEALIYLPSIASFRQTFLEQRVANAQIAALAMNTAPDAMISVDQEHELLQSAGVIAVVLPLRDRTLFLGYDLIPFEDDIDARYDIRNASLADLIQDAITTLNARGQRVIQVVATPTLDGARMIELTLDETALFTAMAEYSNTILLLSLVVSIFTGVLIYLTLHWLVVRPLRSIKGRISDFRGNPEKAQTPSALVRRRDELGIIGRELIRMQDEVRQSIQQKSRLADLGEAVAKINHDLRNILATAQLASDSLQSSKDPRVQKVSGRLISAMDRAIALCERTMAHGTAREPAPDQRMVNLSVLVSDVYSSLDIPGSAHIHLHNHVAEDHEIWVDEAQMHRVLLNISRNAVQAQIATNSSQSSDGQTRHGGNVEISADLKEDGSTLILVRDSGAGIPAQALPNLFKAFNTSNRSGGTGLGLAISREIIIAHGGQISLESTGDTGTSFVILLPGPPPNP